MDDYLGRQHEDEVLQAFDRVQEEFRALTEEAEEEILSQLRACQEGDIDPEELEAARRSAVNSMSISRSLFVPAGTRTPISLASPRSSTTVLMCSD